MHCNNITVIIFWSNLPNKLVLWDAYITQIICCWNLKRKCRLPKREEIPIVSTINIKLQVNYYSWTSQIYDLCFCLIIWHLNKLLELKVMLYNNECWVYWWSCYIIIIFFFGINVTEKKFYHMWNQTHDLVTN